MSRLVRPLPWIIAAAFALRLGAGLAATAGVLPFAPGPLSFWERGYTHFAALADHVVTGQGLGLVYDSVTGVSWSRRPPLYPLVLAGTMALFGRSDLPPISLQSAFGAATVLVTYGLAALLFPRPVALVAAALVAVHPYFVVHDTVLQETSLFTLLVSTALWLLLRCVRTPRVAAVAAAGAVTGLAALCKETVLPFAVAALAWIVVAVPGPRLALGAVFAAAVLLTVAPWVARNIALHGRPVFVLSSGIGLWSGNNAFVARHYPLRTVDLAFAEAQAALSARDRSELASLSEVDRDRWFRDRAIAFALADPGTVARLAATKALAATGLVLSPVGGVARALVYSAWHAPVFALGLAGLWWNRRRWREVTLVMLLAASSGVVFVLAWVHTSHRAFLDVPMAVFAAAALTRLCARARVPADVRLAGVAR